MGQILHGSATTTHAVRAAIQRSKASIKELAAQHNLDTKTIAYKIQTFLTDNDIQFADLPKNRSGPTAMWRGHPFDHACGRHEIERRLTKPNHPWTNGQTEHMNRTLKEAAIKHYHSDSLDQLRRHLEAFLKAYNYAKQLKALREFTPFEYIYKIWTETRISSG